MATFYVQVSDADSGVTVKEVTVTRWSDDDAFQDAASEADELAYTYRGCIARVVDANGEPAYSAPHLDWEPCEAVLKSRIDGTVRVYEFQTRESYRDFFAGVDDREMSVVIRPLPDRHIHPDFRRTLPPPVSYGELVDAIRSSELSEEVEVSF